jgi:amino acid transporter
MNLPKKPLSVISLVMINVIAIDSLRTLPMSAEYGFSLVFYYIIAALTFFLPVALVAAELATGWPQSGGIYVWVREAFGKKIGFITIWLQWFYNICWYPTIMAFIAATLAYCFNPSLTDNKTYMLSVITLFFWGSTLVNFFGMKTSSIFSTIAAIAGTLVPMVFIIILGCVWMGQGHPLQIAFSWATFFPQAGSINNLVLITGIMFGLAGMEMSASHAAEVKNPQNDYPKAAVWSGIIILTSLIFASLAIALVIPSPQLNIVSGLLQAFDLFLKAFHLDWLTPVIALLMVCGALGGVNAWLLGPSKGLLEAGRDGCLPAFMTRTNRKDVPVAILLIQGVIFTLLCSVFLLMPTVSSSFWVLSAVTSILAFIVYIAMFAAALRLRYKFPEVKRAFIIPGGKIGLWAVCLLGLLSCVVTCFVGFFPPSQVPVGNLLTYELILCGGVIAGCLLPWGVIRMTESFRGR